VEFKHGTCTGDLPPIEKLRENLSRADWSKFRQVDKRQLAKLDRLEMFLRFPRPATLLKLS